MIIKSRKKKSKNIAIICNKRILKMGDKYIVVIPKPLIDGEMLRLKQVYRFRIEEI